VSIYDRLAVGRLSLTPEETSYFVPPSTGLDPTLFAGTSLKSDISRGVHSALYHFWSSRYSSPESWSHIWLAGSGVSYLWEAARDPGDLDCLVGVDYVSFRRSNPALAGLSDDEIQSVLNTELHDELWPLTDRWHGYELTFYALPTADIRELHPYAAYDVTEDRWTVFPDPTPRPPIAPEWETISSSDTARAADIVNRYSKALDEQDGVNNPGLRLNAQITLRAAAREASDLYDEIHEGRSKAFSPEGHGFNDFNEYRYKAAKGSGAIKALSSIRDQLEAAGLAENDDIYGGLPDARQTLIKAAIQQRYK
jgi:hypothetical protein